jgi:hypothetical protein
MESSLETSNEHHNSTMTFTDLPFEIRSRIYEFAVDENPFVVYGGRFLPEPIVNLLRVSKSVREDMHSTGYGDITFVLRDDYIGARGKHGYKWNRIGLSAEMVFGKARFHMRHLAFSADLGNSRDILRFLPQLTSLKTVTLTTIDADGQWRIPGKNINYRKKTKIEWTGDDEVDAETFQDEYEDKWIQAKIGLARQLLEAGGVYELPTWGFKVIFQCCFSFDKRGEIENGKKGWDIVKIKMRREKEKATCEEIDEEPIDLEPFSGGQVVNARLSRSEIFQRVLLRQERLRQTYLEWTASQQAAMTQISHGTGGGG